MASKTSIEWTSTFNADGTITPGSTWNPVTGCTEVSPGCDHCYARVFAERWRGTPDHPYEQGFDLKMWPQRLALPVSWKSPRRIFVNSMSDLFHKDIPDSFIVQVFETMALHAPWHIYQVLTKRPSRLVNTSLLTQILDRIGTWPAHIWFGVSVENSQYTWRVDALRRVPVPLRFISAEPLLGPIVLDLSGISWVITGAESGHGARALNVEWVRLLRDQCVEHNVRFFLKQYAIKGKKIPTPMLDGRTWTEIPEVPNWNQ